MMEDIVLGCVMFKRPPGWGFRIVEGETGILLQSTNDKGQTWKDDSAKGLKATVPEKIIF